MNRDKEFKTVEKILKLKLTWSMLQLFQQRVSQVKYNQRWWLSDADQTTPKTDARGSLEFQSSNTASQGIEEVKGS